MTPKPTVTSGNVGSNVLVVWREGLLCLHRNQCGKFLAWRVVGSVGLTIRDRRGLSISCTVEKRDSVTFASSVGVRKIHFSIGKQALKIFQPTGENIHVKSLRQLLLLICSLFLFSMSCWHWWRYRSHSVLIYSFITSPQLVDSIRGSTTG